MSAHGDTAESLVGLINQLVEVAAPAPVSMLPQTPGWAVLGGGVFVALVWGIRRAWRHHHATAYRRAALMDLARAGDNPVTVSTILKRAALAVYPRAEVASLSGDDWLRFLDDTGGDGQFQNGVGVAVGQAAYAPPPQGSHDGLNALACRWVRIHTVETPP